MSNELLILEMVQRLTCLGLEGQPASQLIPGTVKIWQQHLARYNTNRLAMAFNAVEASATRWPTVAQIIACLPKYEHTYRADTQYITKQEKTPEERAESARRVNAMIADLANKLRTEH